MVTYKCSNTVILCDKVNIHNYRYNAVECIRKMINYNRINQLYESNEIYNQLVTLLEENVSIICISTRPTFSMEYRLQFSMEIEF